MDKRIVFFDTEVDIVDGKINDCGAVDENNSIHTTNLKSFIRFLSDSNFICGHNIIQHDLVYIKKNTLSFPEISAIDTLFWSPLLFPMKPYHSLLKDDKIQTDSVNNPLNDSIKAKELFYDEINAFNSLNENMKHIYYGLLYDKIEFKVFFEFIGYKSKTSDIENVIRKEFRGKICSNASLNDFIRNHAIALAYALALINTHDRCSITPPWVLKSYPYVENIIYRLCNTPCKSNCEYCRNMFDIHKGLKKYFGYDNFRTYNGEPLQQRATQAAIDKKSLLAIFPTGGGKSITFQLPALMAGEAAHGLTVVISPLLSLMKDQVDNLVSSGISDAVTINGLLDPISRAEAISKVKDGTASLLYISPEMLRSRTIESLLLSRNVVRFVIDEAHCFSAWGQDFRVDYLYIGDFIKELSSKKNNGVSIPVSCFTATAKQKVITDIYDYFKRKLNIELNIYSTDATRENLHYVVLHKETDEEKYDTVRNLIKEKDCPTIVYVSRTRRTYEIAEKLSQDGFSALPFNGKMDSSEKVKSQEAFMQNEVKVIVATSAFGMGVDKKDVGLVIHYDISDSLENYIQEAGRAGRDPHLQAECFVLFNDNDLDKHFILLNQTKLSVSEIQQIWKAIKDMSHGRPHFCSSALEIARAAGWDDSVSEIETRVKTAISALENAGYIKRGRNVPHVYATSILVKNMDEAVFKINRSNNFSDEMKLTSKRIIKSLISAKSICRAGNDDAETRVDYLADVLAIPKETVIDSVNLLRQENILADSKDMSAYILKSDTQNKSMLVLDRFSKLELFMLDYIEENGGTISYKKLNEAAIESGINSSTVKNIRTLIYYLKTKHYITESRHDNDVTDIALTYNIQDLKSKHSLRVVNCTFELDELYMLAGKVINTDESEAPVLFSLVELFNGYNIIHRLDFSDKKIYLADIEDALLYLSKIGSLRLEGGFLVTYNAMDIKRLVMDNKIRYKLDDYKLLNEFYEQKIRQIHIVGEYANLMVKDSQAALEFVADYFKMHFKKFINKYFKDERATEISRNITPKKYNKLFGELSEIQAEIINDKNSRYIVVGAGPGSGKTMVLVHKLASLLLLEDVKHEQLLMLTFSRAAASEFKKRLIELVGNAAHFVTDIKTFHSYCFDLMGKIGTLEASDNIVKAATDMILNGEVEQGKMTKSVLVIDEAQDMDINEFNLVRALIMANDDMRVIAVGDDDQNIFEFRGSDSKYMQMLISEYGAKYYEMTENYRSAKSIVSFANDYVTNISNRMKLAPILPIREDDGNVQIVIHSSRYFEQAIIDDIISNDNRGKTCVLTATNDEALRIYGLLSNNNVKAKLIQSNDDFNLYNLAEIRYFIKIIDKYIKTPVISNDLWDKAKSLTLKKYENSWCYENVSNMINEFHSLNKTKYYTDLIEFIKESKYEDFYTQAKDAVLVSTIHKSKGREFDSVYIYLDNPNIDTDEKRRAIYVALTRAKSNLIIHLNKNIFGEIKNDNIKVVNDDKVYEMPEEIRLQLGYKDVFLSYFKNMKNYVLKLKSSDKLNIKLPYLTANINGKNIYIAKLSKLCLERLEYLKQKGYVPIEAYVRFIVAWKGAEDDIESAVILPDITLRLKDDK